MNKSLNGRCRFASVTSIQVTRPSMVTAQAYSTGGGQDIFGRGARREGKRVWTRFDKVTDARVE